MLRVLGFCTLVAFTSGQGLCDGYISPNLGGCRPFKESEQYCNAVQLCGASLTCQNSRCELVDACAPVYEIGEATKDLFESIWSETGTSGDGHKLDSSMFASDAQFEHVFLIHNNTVMNLPLPPGSEGVVLLVDGLKVLEAPQVVVMYPSQPLCATDPHFQVFISGIDDEGRSAAITMMMQLGVVEEEADEATTRQATSAHSKMKMLLKIKSASSVKQNLPALKPAPKWKLIQAGYICEGRGGYDYEYSRFSTVKNCARNCANTAGCTTFSANSDTGCRVVGSIHSADCNPVNYNSANGGIYEIEGQPAGTKCSKKEYVDCSCAPSWEVYDSAWITWCCAYGPSLFNNGKPTCPPNGPAGTKCSKDVVGCICEQSWEVYDDAWTTWCCADGPSSFNNGNPTCP